MPITLIVIDFILLVFYSILPSVTLLPCIIVIVMHVMMSSDILPDRQGQKDGILSVSGLCVVRLSFWRAHGGYTYVCRPF